MVIVRKPIDFLFAYGDISVSSSAPEMGYLSERYRGGAVSFAAADGCSVQPSASLPADWAYKLGLKTRDDNRIKPEFREEYQQRLLARLPNGAQVLGQQIMLYPDTTGRMEAASSDYRNIREKPGQSIYPHLRGVHCDILAWSGDTFIAIVARRDAETAAALQQYFPIEVRT